MRKIVVTCVLLMLFLDAFPQSWESIRNNEEYLWGDGFGASVREADKQALDNLSSQIITVVNSESYRTLHSTNKNGELDEESQFTHSVKTYSQATLTNTKMIVLQKEPEAHVVRWIKRTEINKIFESRKLKVKDMVNNAVMAEQKGKIDDALRNYYWALSLLKSLQYPNDVLYTDLSGTKHVLTNWIKVQMDDIFRNLKVTFDGKKDNDVKLSISYKGKPVSSIDYTYWDCRSWSNIYSAKDGCGIVELDPETIDTSIQLKYEYEYAGESKIDKEIEVVLNELKGTPMPKASIRVELNSPSESSKELSVLPQSGEMSFTTTNAARLVKPKTKEKEAEANVTITKKIVEAISLKDFLSVRDYFTEEGWDMFTKLIRYGKAKVLDSSNICFYNKNGQVTERGLKMSFAFNSNVRKAFVEDIVLSFDEQNKICGLAFGLGKTAEDDILNKGVWDEKSRFAIMSFLENYKTAYALKRLDYIKSIFDDEAVIITGSVVKRASQTVNIENQSQIKPEGNKIIKMNRQTKDQYLKNLKRCFELNEFVNIRFANNDVIKLGSGGETYAIQIAQDYYSSSYGDFGYLMLIVDINDPAKPLIKVRTWQPEKDPQFGLYGPGNF